MNIGSTMLSKEGFLGRTAARKRAEIKEARKRAGIDELRRRAEEAPKARDFRAPFLSRFSVIAEIKQASPSKGKLTEHFDPEKIACDYERGGASAISVLTDEEDFQGSKETLAMVRAITPLPVLRKEFIIDEYQILESRLLGADAVLLISELLTLQELRRFIELAISLGMSPLVEGHTREAIQKAVDAGADIIGINNRDLDSLALDMETSFQLRGSIPSTAVAISESGIQSSTYLMRLRDAGFSGALIGENLMVSNNREESLRQLLLPLRTNTNAGS